MQVSSSILENRGGPGDYLISNMDIMMCKNCTTDIAPFLGLRIFVLPVLLLPLHPGSEGSVGRTPDASIGMETFLEWWLWCPVRDTQGRGLHHTSLIQSFLYWQYLLVDHFTRLSLTIVLRVTTLLSLYCPVRESHSLILLKPTLTKYTTFLNLALYLVPGWFTLSFLEQGLSNLSNQLAILLNPQLEWNSSR